MIVNLTRGALAVFATGGLLSAALANDWAEFENETSTRFLVAPALGASDPEEKDYAWGDVNNNGWTDLVIMRKQPFSTPGRRINVLMINEEGVLVDRTSQYATATDVPGDEGFLTPTNDRHSVLADLTNNGWLDLATAPAYGGGLSKPISHPRVYRNLADTGPGGAWAGFIFENNRTPQLASAPNTCAVAAGDLTQNGSADLYFVTYSQSAPDFLLVNNGSGVFTHNNLNIPNTFANSSFGTSGVIADITGNGRLDIIKAENGPVKIAYHNTNNTFTANTPTSGAHYHVNLADLNNNGRLDMIVVDDGQDRVRLNQSTSGGQVNWSGNIMLPESSCGNGNACFGFGGNVYAADLNNNGWNDILVADVDVDISGCNRHANIYRNNANGPNVTFTWDPGNIPANMLQGTFDFGLLDITGNGWIDVVAGRCTGTQVWISQPPYTLVISYPEGRPDLVSADTPFAFPVHLEAAGSSLKDAALKVSIDGGQSFETFSMAPLGNDNFEAILPPAQCGEVLEYYIAAELDNDAVFTDPPQAPNHVFEAAVAAGFDVVLEEDFDTVVPGWSIQNDPSLTQGAWQLAVPTGAMLGPDLAAPNGDSSPSGSGQAFVTCAGCVGVGCVSTCNVAGGPTHLVSPTLDLSGIEFPVIVYDRWFFCNHQNTFREDFLETWVSNDGGNTWVFVHKTGGTGSQWESASFVVNEYVEPTSNVVVRFSVEDTPANSITNAGIDNFTVEEITCDGDDPVTPCPADVTGDSVVNIFDLLFVLSNWGECPDPQDCPADVTGDGVVNIFDLLNILSNWGDCPGT